MENRELAVQDPSTVWTPEQVDTFRNTVAYGANDRDLKMYLSLAAKYDLDPFAREIWCIKMGGRTVITTSRDGYLKIANRNPNYDGMTSDVVHAGDKFMKQGNEIHHAYTLGNRGAIVGAYAMVYRKDRNTPSYFFAPFNEYNKGGGVWAQYPSAMIVKVAESMALKRAFSISGLTTEEEVGNGDKERPQAQAQQQPPQPRSEFSDYERRNQLRDLWTRYLAVCDNQPEHAKNAMMKITGKNSFNSADYTDEDIKALHEDVVKREDEQAAREIAERNAAEAAGQPIDAETVTEQEANNGTTN